MCLSLQTSYGPLVIERHPANVLDDILMIYCNNDVIKEYKDERH
jgi:hypothetical protein